MTLVPVFLHGIVALYCIRTNVPFLSLRLWVPREVLFLKVNFLYLSCLEHLTHTIQNLRTMFGVFGSKQCGSCGPAGVVEYAERMDVLAFCSTTFYNFELLLIIACCSFYIQGHLNRKQSLVLTHLVLFLHPQSQS